jgi:hypothetical protein
VQDEMAQAQQGAAGKKMKKKKPMYVRTLFGQDLF